MYIPHLLCIFKNACISCSLSSPMIPNCLYKKLIMLMHLLWSLQGASNKPQAFSKKGINLSFVSLFNLDKSAIGLTIELQQINPELSTCPLHPNNIKIFTYIFSVFYMFNKSKQSLGSASLRYLYILRKRRSLHLLNLDLQ